MSAAGGGRTRRAALSLALAAGAAGCTQWHVTQATPYDLVEEDKEPVRITEDGEVKLVLYNLSIKADTLVGYISAGAINSTRVPLTYIRQLEVRKFSPLKTFGLVAIIGGALFLLQELAGSNNSSTTVPGL